MRAAPLALTVLALAGCADPAPERLSAWGLFADLPNQTPADGVVPYDIVSPLFSDYATKHRFIRLPAGTSITYTAEGDWVYPVGTVLVKTFGFLHDLRDPSAGERIIETRLLVLDGDGEWSPYVYLWDDALGDGVHRAAGARVSVSWLHTDGATRELPYRVPNEVQCANCHGGALPPSPIGPRAEQLNRDYDYGAGPENQIDHLIGLGWLGPNVPAERPRFEDPAGEGDLDARARAYLDANCAHCHNENGAAGQSGLWLGAQIAEPATYGVCKRPVAAGAGAGGRTYDIVPGEPDASVMIFRMESEEPGIKMPELPTLQSHAEGVALIRDWIAAMTPTGCD